MYVGFSVLVSKRCVSVTVKEEVCYNLVSPTEKSSSSSQIRLQKLVAATGRSRPH